MYIKLTVTDPVTKARRNGNIFISRTVNEEKGIVEQDVDITDAGSLCILRTMLKGPFEVDKNPYPKIRQFFRNSDKKMIIINRLKKILKRLFFKMCLQAMTIVQINEYAMHKLYEEICFSDIRVFAILILRMSTWREMIVDINGKETTNLRDILKIYASPEEDIPNLCDDTLLVQMSLCNYIQDQNGDKSEIGMKAEALLQYFNLKILGTIDYERENKKLQRQQLTFDEWSEHLNDFVKPKDPDDETEHKAEENEGKIKEIEQEDNDSNEPNENSENDAQTVEDREDANVIEPSGCSKEYAKEEKKYTEESMEKGNNELRREEESHVSCEEDELALQKLPFGMDQDPVILA